jgi:hypothetical protein
MARILTIALASVLSAAPLQAQVANTSAQNPWDVSEDEKSLPDFDIVDDSTGPGPATKGSVIIAGTELVPNAMVGFGMFGERAERADHARTTNRDYTMPKTRKAAVGVALRF